MEFEDEHDEEQEEEEDEDITIPPPTAPPSYTQPLNSAPHRVFATAASPSCEARRSGVVRYKECLKNHAVNIGGHALDGCGEFMAAGEEGTLDALKCAACNCHRNFHRKELGGNNDSGGGDGAKQLAPAPPHNMGSGNAGSAGTTTLYPQFSAYYRTPAPHSRYLHVSSHHQHPLTALPSSNTSGGTHSGDMGDDMSHPSSSGGCGRDSGGPMMMMMMGGGGSNSSKKRFRTKFTQEQKDKMLAFAEKLGWRIQKHDEAAVQQFCAENKVKRQVLKVWMHNNKHTLGKKP